ncbi:MAG TPA: hypothetical protein H9987_09880, partial [Candidatus Luteococcus avicola]|nr:hypothetical protein [Candidatus Luteococcus avicola]
MPRPTPKGRKPYTSSTSKPAKKGPKSFKADGTPKQRWTSDKRATEGHTPRRGGTSRPWEGDERPRSFERDDRAP